MSLAGSCLVNPIILPWKSASLALVVQLQTEYSPPSLNATKFELEA